jgi:hypothetical protein
MRSGGGGVNVDIPFQLAVVASQFLAERRRRPGTRDGACARSCGKQAVITPGWFRIRPDICRPGQGFRDLSDLRVPPSR